MAKLNKMNLNELLKEIPQHPYYPNDECSDELVLIEYDQNEVQTSGPEWTTQTTLWMMALALMLWLITYLMVMTVTMCFDFGFRSVATFTGLVQWYNETSVMTYSDQQTRYIKSLDKLYHAYF